MVSGCNLNIKVGEVARPSTYKAPKPVPAPTTHGEAWVLKQLESKAPQPPWERENSFVEDATATAQAWLSHPANKMQLPSLQKLADTDGDGVTSRAEFKNLLRAAGSNADDAVLFSAMDADGDGVLSEAEIKALGHGKSGR